MATRWNGGYHTKDFLVRQMMLNGRWIGFFNEKEAADAGDDGFGDKIATGEPGSNPDRVYYESTQARRTFWTARIGKTKEFTEGTHDRLFDVTRVPGAPEYLEAGLLIQQGTKQPLRLQDPNGFLVLHRTRLGEEGRLALTGSTTTSRPNGPLPCLFTICAIATKAQGTCSYTASCSRPSVA